MSLPGRLLDVDGVSVFVHRRGKGPRVVLLHGYLMSHWYFRDVIADLAADHEVLAIDLPGHGESDRPAPGRYRYCLDQMAQTVLGVLDREEIDRAAVIGHSMGGGVALDVAAQAPHRVNGVVAEAAAAYEPPLDHPLAPLLLRPGIGELLFKRGYQRRLFAADLRNLAYSECPDLVTEQVVDYWWERLNRPGGRDAAYALLHHLCTLAPIRDRLNLSAARLPILLLWGERDPLQPLDRGRRLAQDLGAPLRVVPCTGHTPHEERPQMFLRLIRSFLSQAPAEVQKESCRSAS